MLNVRNGASAVEFYQRAFGAKVLYRIESPDGEIVAQLAIQGAQFWVADEAPAWGNFSPASLDNRSSFRLVLTVADPDTVFASAIAAGAKKVQPMKDHEYGWRVGRVVDPYGHHWEIGKPLS